mgnify:FL=1
MIDKSDKAVERLSRVTADLRVMLESDGWTARREDLQRLAGNFDRRASSLADRIFYRALMRVGAVTLAVSLVVVLSRKLQAKANHR